MENYIVQTSRSLTAEEEYITQTSRDIKNITGVFAQTSRSLLYPVLMSFQTWRKTNPVKTFYTRSGKLYYKLVLGVKHYLYNWK